MANVFQARLYNRYDLLIEKKAFTSLDEAVNYVEEIWSDELHGCKISRGIIRYIMPVLNQWAIRLYMPNPHALLHDGVNSDNWRISYYGLKDQVAATEYFDEEPSPTYLLTRMMTFNANYCVVCCHEAGTSELLYSIMTVMENPNVNLEIIPEGKVLSDYKLTQEQIKLLKPEDQEETRQINLFIKKLKDGLREE